jgi:two-component system cell cycle sensor histidine kinase/response regulator CckA
MVQVLLNLVTNAIQAINVLRPWGKIEISSAVIENRVRISVTDDGPGVAEKNLGRVFEPFFTTKETGTGLGLSLSRKIIRDNGGDMWISSVESRGATFTIELPVVEEETESEGGSSGRPRSGGAKSILVVDDEDHIAELIESVVEANGYTADRLNDGAPALDLLRKKHYDLLICDLHMPGVGGRDVIEWVRSSNKPVKILVLTGDVIGAQTGDFVKSCGAHLLSKPFSIGELIGAVEQVFD